jgi:sec-independent protein translocase protein TatA
MLARETLSFLGSIGPWELVIIMFVVLMVFGNRLPDVMKSIGKGMTQFKRGLREVEDEIMSEPSIPEGPKQIDATAQIESGTEKDSDHTPDA